MVRYATEIFLHRALLHMTATAGRTEATRPYYLLHAPIPPPSKEYIHPNEYIHTTYMRHLISGNIDRGAEVNGAAVRAVIISVGVCRRPSLAACRREQDLHTAEKQM